MRKVTQKEGEKGTEQRGKSHRVDGGDMTRMMVGGAGQQDVKMYA